MKKCKKTLLLFVLMAASASGGYVHAQKINEGKVVYEISYPDADLPDEQMAMMPTESIVYFKDDHSRVETKMGMGMNMVMLLDNKTKTLTSLMDMMGNKISLKMTEEDLKKQKEKKGTEDYQVKLTDETKDIAGYKCKKAIATGKDGSFDVYYTDQITYKKGDWAGNEFKGIDGFLMQFKKTEGSITMEMIVKKVTEEKVDDAMFSVPSDYKSMTLEEVQKMYGDGK